MEVEVEGGEYVGWCPSKGRGGEHCNCMNYRLSFVTNYFVLFTHEHISSFDVVHVMDVTLFYGSQTWF